MEPRKLQKLGKELLGVQLPDELNNIINIIVEDNERIEYEDLKWNIAMENTPIYYFFYHDKNYLINETKKLLKYKNDIIIVQIKTLLNKYDIPFDEYIDIYELYNEYILPQFFYIENIDEIIHKMNKDDIIFWRFLNDIISLKIYNKAMNLHRESMNKLLGNV